MKEHAALIVMKTKPGNRLLRTDTFKSQPTMTVAPTPMTAIDPYRLNRSSVAKKGLLGVICGAVRARLFRPN